MCDTILFNIRAQKQINPSHGLSTFFRQLYLVKVVHLQFIFHFILRQYKKGTNKQINEWDEYLQLQVYWLENRIL